ncbi:hypothetical protein GIV27_18960, partial [Pseudomonas syringae]|nr:hypothetical protein [Pseudomonas syringae]
SSTPPPEPRPPIALDANIASLNAIQLRWVGKDVQREEIAQEFESMLEAKAGDAAQLALGSFLA